MSVRKYSLLSMRVAVRETPRVAGIPPRQTRRPVMPPRTEQGKPIDRFGPILLPNPASVVSRARNRTWQRISTGQLCPPDRRDDGSLVRSRKAPSHQCPCRLRSVYSKLSTLAPQRSSAPGAETFVRYRLAEDLG